MRDALALRYPPSINELEEATHGLGFAMRSDPLTLDLLRTLAATKVAGQFLELGTGTGISASWIRDGIDAQSHTNSRSERQISNEVQQGEMPRWNLYHGTQIGIS